MQNNEDKAVDIAVESRIYEVGYLFLPTVPEENLVAACGDLKDLIYSLDGNFIADEMPQMKNLEYPMLKIIANARKKFDKAYFGWIKFEMDPSSLPELTKKLEADANILRFLLIKTVRENTIATKRFASKDMIRRKTTSLKKTDEAPVEINKEEIDKEIDAMVASEAE